MSNPKYPLFGVISNLAINDRVSYCYAQGPIADLDRVMSELRELGGRNLRVYFRGPRFGTRECLKENATSFSVYQRWS